MNGSSKSNYGERWADVYDGWVAERIGAEETEQAVRTLADLARGGRALELGIGTGRLALPLAEHGISVEGIDASRAMIERLREKAGGEAIPITVADFSQVAVKGEFDLVFVAFNTFFALSTQEEQVRCFRNVAEHLSDDGVFVIEAFVPDPARFEDGQTVRALRIDDNFVDLEVSRHDPTAQTVMSHHVTLTADGVRLLPVAIRYAWPSELDLMAELAGLKLRDRWGGWDRSSFRAANRAHVSVYGRA